MFQTLEARDTVENTGVGLAIVKKIVESEGGTIQLESQLGAGGNIFLYLAHSNSKFIGSETLTPRRINNS